MPGRVATVERREHLSAGSPPLGQEILKWFGWPTHSSKLHAGNFCACGFHVLRPRRTGNSAISPRHAGNSGMLAAERSLGIAATGAGESERRGENVRNKKRKELLMSVIRAQTARHRCQEMHNGSVKTQDHQESLRGLRGMQSSGACRERYTDRARTREKERRPLVSRSALLPLGYLTHSSLISDSLFILPFFLFSVKQWRWHCELVWQGVPCRQHRRYLPCVATSTTKSWLLAVDLVVFQSPLLSQRRMQKAR